MTTAEIVAIICAVFTAAGLLITVVEKIWGGGNALASKFSALEIKTMNDMFKLRSELMQRVDTYEDNYGVGIEAIRANIQAIQLGTLEFRAKMAEELHSYIRREDYNAGLMDIKRDVQVGFKAVDERLGQMQDLIMYVHPDAIIAKPRR